METNTLKSYLNINFMIAIKHNLSVVNKEVNFYDYFIIIHIIYTLQVKTVENIKKNTVYISLFYSF